MFDGLGLDDTLIIDMSNGALSFAEGIEFNGGDGVNDVIVDGDTAFRIGPDRWRSSVDCQDTVLHRTDATAPADNTSADPQIWLRCGVSAAATAFGDLASDPSKLSRAIPLVGSSLPRAIGGATFGNQKPVLDPTPGGAVPAKPLGSVGHTILQRMIETGLGAFAIDAIGTVIPDATTLAIGSMASTTSLAT